MLAVRAVVALVALSYVAPASGQVPPFIGQEEAKLTASDGAMGDRFGFSVALDDETAVVGARAADHSGGVNAGTAYVYVRSGQTWSEQAKLIAPDAEASDQFGSSVDVQGDTIVVGAEDAGANDAGATYVFTRTGSTWSYQATLTPSDGASGDNFGTSVALDDDTVVVGARFADALGGSNRGAAYVFTRTGTVWSEQAKLIASDGMNGDFFGDSVAIEADTVVVGAYRNSPGGLSSAGAAYVFTRSGKSWTEQQKLTASDAAAQSFFGSSVAIDGETVISGANGDMAGIGVNTGAAYAFTRSGTSWSEEAKLIASDAVAGMAFAHYVDISNDTAVAAAFGESTGTDTAYVFVRDGSSWTEHASLTALDAELGDETSTHPVAISGDTVLVGTGSDDLAAGVNTGSAYVFRLITIGTWADLGSGTAGSAGIPSLAGTGLMLAGSPTVWDLAGTSPLSTAFFIIGATSISAPFKGGVMVPNPDLFFTFTTDFIGSLQLNAIWPPGVPSGLAIYFQCWIPDAGGPVGFAASNAVSATAP